MLKVFFPNGALFCGPNARRHTGDAPVVYDVSGFGCGIQAVVSRGPENISFSREAFSDADRPPPRPKVLRKRQTMKW